MCLNMRHQREIESNAHRVQQEKLIQASRAAGGIIDSKQIESINEMTNESIRIPVHKITKTIDDSAIDVFADEFCLVTLILNI